MQPPAYSPTRSSPGIISTTRKATWSLHVNDENYRTTCWHRNFYLLTANKHSDSIHYGNYRNYGLINECTVMWKRKATKIRPCIHRAVVWIYPLEYQDISVCKHININFLMQSAIEYTVTCQKTLETSWGQGDTGLSEVDYSNQITWFCKKAPSPASTKTEKKIKTLTS